MTMTHICLFTRSMWITTGAVLCFRKRMYLKISILMGVTWIIDFVGWLAVSKLFPKWYWAVFDIGNIIQSFGIFVIFVCNKDMRNRIVTKYNNTWNMLSF